MIRILCGTGHLLLLPFVYAWWNGRANVHEENLSNLLVLSYLGTQLFWRFPIRGSIVHHVDGLVAKTSITYFIVYTVASKKVHLDYYAWLCTVFGSAYASHRCSSTHWLGTPHLLSHAVLHLSCTAASMYAFWKY